MGIPLCVICCFSLPAFNICSLCLIFVNFINMCLGVFHLGFILFGTPWVSWTWVATSFPILAKSSAIISSSNFSWPFFSLECSGVFSNEFCDGYVLGVTLGSLYVDTPVYVTALLKNLRAMSCSGACWLLGGGWFWCRCGGFWMVSYSLMFCVVRSFLVFSGFGLKFPASGFQFYSSNRFKTSPTMQH